MMKRLRLALALAAIFCAPMQASAASQICVPSNSGQCYPTMILIDPSTGLPTGGFPSDLSFSGTLDASQNSGPTSYKDVVVTGHGLLVANIAGLTGSGATITYTSTVLPATTPTFAINAYNAATATLSGTRTTDGDVRIPVAGRAVIRFAVTTPGSAVSIALKGTATGLAVSGIVDLGSPIPAGTNNIGSVNVSGGGYAASGVTPVISTFTTTGQSASLTPLAGRNFNITLYGTFVATIQLERLMGTQWVPITAAGTQLYKWTVPASESDSEDQTGVQYRLNCTSYTSGTVNYRLEQ